MSVRKREWTTPSGEKKTAWLVDYRDSAGKRRAKQFKLKKQADAWALKTGVEVADGTHTADSQSVTVATAAEDWLAHGRRENLEQSTLGAYEQHVRLHITPFIGGKKLTQLTRPMVEEFRDALLDSGRSRAMAKRVLGDLTAIVKNAMRLGYVAKNVCVGVTVKRSGREKTKAVPPSKEHIRALIESAGVGRPMDKPLMLVLIFAGLRASEVRGLAWRNVDLTAGTITIDQRADFKNVIGPPKSASGFRVVPVPPMVVNELRLWKLRCPPSKLGLVFPSEAGTPIFHANLVLGFQEPIQIRAGLCRPRLSKGKPVLDKDGHAVMEGIYALHDFRHACASLWIERRVPPKKVQSWMGHHSIQVTFDTYGHLFAAQEDDAAVMAALQAEIMGSPDATRMQHEA